MPTAVETRDEIVRWLWGRGWVPLDELAPFLRSLGLGSQTGDRDLRELRLEGRIERVALESEDQGRIRPYAYRAVVEPPAGRTRIERKIRQTLPERIVAFVRLHGPSSVRRLCTGLGVAPRSVDYALQVLGERVTVEYTGPRRSGYRIVSVPTEVRS